MEISWVKSKVSAPTLGYSGSDVFNMVLHTTVRMWSNVCNVLNIYKLRSVENYLFYLPSEHVSNIDALITQRAGVSPNLNLLRLSKNVLAIGFVIMLLKSCNYSFQLYFIF